MPQLPDLQEILDRRRNAMFLREPLDEHLYKIFFPIGKFDSATVYSFIDYKEILTLDELIFNHRNLVKRLNERYNSAGVR